VVLSDALVLTCGHDLCLSCAGAALRNTRSIGGRVVQCRFCNERTQICEEAAATLMAQPPPPMATSVSSQAARLTQQPGQGLPLTEDTFNLIDRNNDGIITRAEWDNAVATGLSPRRDATGDIAAALRIGADRYGLQPTSYLPEGKRRSQFLPSDMPSAGLSPRTQPTPSDGSSAAAASPLASRNGMSPRSTPQVCMPVPLGANRRGEDAAWHGRLAHIPRCPYHPEEQAEFFCATCECFCICAECVVQKSGQHHGHEVMRVQHAHEKLRARAGVLLDEAVRLEDEFAMVVDRLMWKRKDIERAAARGRASVRSAFERVRTQLNDREGELLESLDTYETESSGKIDEGNGEFVKRLEVLRGLQEQLRTRCRSGTNAVEALNTYAQAKMQIAKLSADVLKEDNGVSEPPEEFIGLAGSARAELDLHAEGLASLERAVRGLCRNTNFQHGSDQAMR